MGKKSEESQHIYCWRTPAIKTEFGNRAMEELGVIKGLEIEDTANYLLVPLKKDGEDTNAWLIHKVKRDSEVEVEDWNNLETTT